MVISGMGKFSATSPNRSAYMQIATIPMKSKLECYENLNAIQNNYENDS